MTAGTVATTARAESVVEKFQRVRGLTDLLASRLSPEDQIPQSMTAASPAAWHRAHTTWFFEEFVLGRLPGYTTPEPVFRFLFNSYYEAVGPRQPRPQRGLITRPSVAEIGDFRARIDEAVVDALEAGRVDERGLELLELGCHHEQQHQELLLTDIKHAFWSNPLHPAYCDRALPADGAGVPLQWVPVPAQAAHIGAARWPEESDGFAYDNESPRHPVLLQPFALANRPVTHGEFRQFIDGGGYRDPQLWLSDGWAQVQAEGWSRPLYWHEDLEQVFTLHGWQRANPDAPACHLSYFEADAFARWAGARLPTEAEWEHVAARADPQDAGEPTLHPRAAGAAGIGGFAQLFGGVWEWTSSAYTAYPGYRPWTGSIGEYNGKFMNAQWVLRGGSCATAPGHVRASYRNFFPSPARWQFTGLRLAKDTA